jgi:DNA-binding GntR family transcriptional regulator
LSTKSEETRSIGAGHRPLRELVCDALRDQILDGRLAPGARLVEDRLAEELAVSRNPVREALRVLAVEGYVELLPRRGAMVASLTPRQVEQVFEVREALEALAARLAARNAGEADRNRLSAIIAETDAALAAGDYARMPELNTRFHGMVLEMADNPVLTDLSHPLRGRVQWIFSRTVQDRAAHSLDEHRRIAEAILAGDEEAAARLATAHVGAALETYRRALADAGSGDGTHEPLVGSEMSPR